MAAPKAQPPEEAQEDWLTTFADAITLLMAFFVMLLTFAEFDIPAYEELTSALANNIGGKEKQSSTQSLKIDVQDMVYEMQADQVVQVGGDEKGVVIELKSNAFFKPGSAEIVAAAIPVLQKLAETLNAPNYELFNIVVEGHTDDGQINTPQFPSNWELSAGRASAVVRLFEASKVYRLRLQATGLADTRPKVPNRDLEGKPIAENRATNRRVVLRLRRMSIDERDAYLLAQELERRAMEKQKKASKRNLPIEQRLPITPHPEDFTAEEKSAKDQIDNLKREIHAHMNENKKLSKEHLERFKGKFKSLDEIRSARLSQFFEEVEQFFGEEEHEPGEEEKETF